MVRIEDSTGQQEVISVSGLWTAPPKTSAQPSAATTRPHAAPAPRHPAPSSSTNPCTMYHLSPEELHQIVQRQQAFNPQGILQQQTDDITLEQSFRTRFTHLSTSL